MPPVRGLSNPVRYRRARIRERTRGIRRPGRIPRDAGTRLSSVVSEDLGVSGRAMLTALVGGTRDPEVMADLARGVPGRKIPALREALRGRFSGPHALTERGDPGQAGLPGRGDRASVGRDRPRGTPLSPASVT
ncbi:hypothetical protein ACFQ36_03380 [Arthrobacter sp. GCM10027362]|uniref:hypothetical protein n=1 Tax=Arthrobacter sp. GCM10027362 TaxID=3273379 RepID=UPI00363E6335